MLDEENSDPRKKILTLLQKVIQRDETLREKYQIGNKFKFIHDRLLDLATQLEAELAAFVQIAEQDQLVVAPDEVLVYVYLFNAQGMVLQTWQKMLNPMVFYEYSVNRPIYLTKDLVEDFIRRKNNTVQHAYLSVAVKQQDILPQRATEEPLKDVFGNVLIKVKEGALKFERLMYFHHDDHEYKVDSSGKIIDKSI